MSASASTTRPLVYLAGFFLNIQAALAAYVSSSFLAQFVGGSRVGLVYTLASIVSLLMSLALIAWERRYGLPKLFHHGLWVCFLGAGLLMFGQSAIVIVPAFILFYSLGFFLRLILDLELEYWSDNPHTGTIRGLFLTIINFAWFISPVITGWLVADQHYGRLYLASALVLVPVIWLSQKSIFRAAVTPRARAAHAWPDIVMRVLRGTSHKLKNVRRVLATQFLLNFFYAIMVIYTPIYLHEHLGFSWPEIGIILTIMLLPFVLLEYPLGWLADRKWGEKELLMAGFLIAGLATACIPLFPGTTVIAWGLLLLATRVGASAIESMSEVYLFKRLDGADTAIIGLSRTMYPLSYLVAPLIASLLISLYSFASLYYFLGAVMLGGMAVASRLEDTN